MNRWTPIEARKTTSSWGIPQLGNGLTLAPKVEHGGLSEWLSLKETIPPAKRRRRRNNPSLKTQVLRFTFILLGSFTLSTFLPVSVISQIT